MSSSIKPRVFVSSTVFDFRDLRTSIKYWLEEMGCEVDMSEFADFRKPLDHNSYDACLRAIEEADYFVLFVGSRVGGWFDPSKKISITRMEYQHAYQRFLADKLTLIPFVRRELWDLRQDRRELEAFLREEHAVQAELAENDIDRITRHRSRFVNDADAIFGFLDEVARVQEMRRATSSQAERPRGNWIHSFTTFEEVVATLKQALGLTGRLRRRGLETNLREEIVSNIHRLLERREGSSALEPLCRTIVALRDELAKQVTPLMGGTSRIDARLMNSFCIYSLSGVTNVLETTFLEEAIRSGEFLSLNRENNQLEAGAEQRLLVELLRAINWYRRCCASLPKDDSLMSKYIRGKGTRKVDVENNDLIAPMTQIDALVDLTRYLGAAYTFLRTGEVVEVPKTIPCLPAILDIPVKESISRTEVVEWLELSRQTLLD